MLAGPIDKPQNLIPQLDKGYGFDYDRVTNGLKLMTWGFFQKWVIADRLAVLVDTIYNDPASYSGIYFVFATFLFAIQIYCDFSAYSDIAIGAGEVLGFKFMKNFNRPYFSKSVSEFWRRWHISLTTWLRDYLFLPIAYSTLRKLNNKPFLKIKPEVWAYCTATVLTMFIAGLWHGASWNFVIWGSLIGVYLVFSYFTKKIRRRIIKLFRLNRFPKIHKLLSASITFSLISFVWIFFRANTIGNAKYIIRHLYTGFSGYFKMVFFNLTTFHFKAISAPFLLGLKPIEFYFTILTILFLFAIQMFQRKRNIREFISKQHFLIRWTGYIIIIFIILLFGKFETRQFIYLQF